MFDWRNLLRARWPYLVVGILLGFTGGYRLYRPRAVHITEGKAPEERLKDGSVLLARDPDAKLPGPPKVLPPGAKVTRTARLEFLPTVGTSGSPLPADIDINLLEMPDGSGRILVSSSTGTITGGIDIPRKPTRPELKWAAGGMYSPGQRSYGVFADRDLGPWRVGLEVVQTQVQGLRSIDAWVKVGIRF